MTAARGQPWCGACSMDILTAYSGLGVLEDPTNVTARTSDCPSAAV